MTRFVSAAAAVALLIAGAGQAAAPNNDGVEVAQAEDDFYCKQRQLGTWFYCDKPEPKPDPARPAAQPQISAKARLAAITGQLDELKAAAP